MTTHWVSNLADGNDANPGTEASPKANPWSVSMADGDTLNVKGGGAAYDRPGVDYVFPFAGRAGITIQRWAGFPKPVVTHTGSGVGYGRALGVGSGGTAMVYVRGFVIQDTIEGGAGSPGAAGAQVTFEDCDFIRNGMTFDNVALGGNICVGATTPIASLYVTRCTFDECGRSNIFAKTTDNLVVGDSSFARPGLATPGVNEGDNIAIADITPAFFWVYNNTLDHSEKNSKQCVLQSGGTRLGWAVIEDNIMIGPTGTGNGTSHNTIHLHMPGIVRRNRITTGGFAILTNGGGEIYSNVITIDGEGYGSNQGPIYCSNATGTGTDIYNNTIVLENDGSGFYSAISMFDAVGGNIKNNIIVGWDVGIRRHSTAVTESHNNVFGATEEVTDQFLNPLAFGTGSITTDPLLDSNYKPLLGSPCIGTGTATGVRIDLAGKPFRAPLMMGALESRGGQGMIVSAGSVSPSGAVASVGASVTFSAGLISPNNDGIVPLTGSQVSSAQQTISPSWSQALAGSATSSAAGTISINLRPTNMVGQLITSGSGVVSAAGDGVTVNITGIDVTASAGIITGGTQALSGLALTTAAGTVLLDLTVPVVGLGIASGIGNVAAEQDAVDTYIASGIGIVALQFSVDLVGEALTSAQGVVSITGDVDVALTGASSTATAGSILIEEAYPITGSSMTASQYNLGAPGGATLTGAEILTVAGEIFTTGDRTYALIGQGMIAQDGITFASSLAFVTGQELTIGMEGIGPREAVLTGISINLSQGRLTALLPEVIGGGGYDYTYLLRKKKKKKEEKPEPITTAKEIVEILEKPRKPKETDAERRKKEEELLLLG